MFKSKGLDANDHNFLISKLNLIYFLDKNFKINYHKEKLLKQSLYQLLKSIIKWRSHVNI